MVLRDAGSTAFAEGLPYLERAVSIHEASGANVFLSRMYWMWADGLLLAGDTEEAIEKTRHALALSGAFGERGVEAEASLLLADIEATSDQLVAAASHHSHAIAIGEELAMRPLLCAHRMGAASARFILFYLPPARSLTPEPPREASSATTYRFDPARPVPSIGGNVSSLRDVLPLPPRPRGPELRRPRRAHRRRHTPGRLRPARGPRLPRLPPALPAAGLPARRVHLWVATSAVDTDFTAKLIDVYPPSAWYPQGYALNLTDSIARLRYRNGRERGELVKAGEPVPVRYRRPGYAARSAPTSAASTRVRISMQDPRGSWRSPTGTASSASAAAMPRRMGHRIRDCRSCA
jgi:hypothetical protein